MRRCVHVLWRSLLPACARPIHSVADGRREAAARVPRVIPPENEIQVYGDQARPDGGSQ